MTTRMFLQRFNYPVRQCGMRLSRRSLSQVVDESELRKFGRIGRDWWDSNSGSGVGPLHDMNPTRVKFIRESLASYHSKDSEPILKQLEGLKILDVGCGGGLLSESLARLGATVTSIDPSEKNIEVAKAHSSKDPKTATIEYQVNTIQEIAKQEKKFDVVCALEVIEHVPDVKDFLSSCFNALKPTGSLFVSTLNKSEKSKLFAIMVAENVLRMVPPGTHDWNKFIAPEDLKKVIENELRLGKLDKMNGIIVHPKSLPRIMLNCRLQWELSDSDLDVNYIAHFVKL